MVNAGSAVGDWDSQINDSGREPANSPAHLTAFGPQKRAQYTLRTTLMPPCVGHGKFVQRHRQICPIQNRGPAHVYKARAFVDREGDRELGHPGTPGPATAIEPGFRRLSNTRPVHALIIATRGLGCPCRARGRGGDGGRACAPFSGRCLGLRRRAS